MERDEFYKAIDAYQKRKLEHGSKWKDHKYIRIENGRYIYPEDLKKSDDSHVVGGNQEKGAAERMQNKAYNEARNAGRKETVRQQAVNEVAKSTAQDWAKGSRHGTKDNDNDLYGSVTNPVVLTDNTAKKLQDKNLKGYGIRWQDVADEGTKQKNISKYYSDAWKKENAEVQGAKKMNEAKKDARQATEDYKKQLQEEKAKAEVKKEINSHEKSALEWKKHKDEALKKEQQARQEESKKITSLSPDEARKRAAEITKQHTPEKPVSSNPKVNDAYKEFRKYVPDSAKEWNGEFDKLDEFLKEKNLSDSEKKELEKLITKDRVKAADSFAPMPGAKSLSGDTSDKNKTNEQLEKQDKNGTSMKTETAGKSSNEGSKDNPYGLVKPEKMNSDQLEAWKDMSRENIEAMDYSAKKFQEQNHRPTKVKITSYDPYTGAPMAGKVTYIDNNGHEQDTGYFFKMDNDNTWDNLNRRIENKKKEKVQHSFDDSKDFYAAVYDYKQAHKR